jgi:hypothetical protein
MNDTEIKRRFTILFWAVGSIAAVQIAMLGMTFTMWQAVASLSYQLGQIAGQLNVLINH